jgi:4'-phosphopantetheinyl transferase
MAHTNPKLPPNTVALWLLQIGAGASRDDALATFGHLLSEAEQEQALTYACGQAAALFVHGRALAQLMLRRHLARVDGPRCRLRIDPGGKPALDRPYSSSELEFNLSHSGSFVGCALAWRRQVGLDLEERGRALDYALVAARHFSAQEQADLMRLEGAPRRERFLYYWTLKEAYLKARGGSIAGQIDEVSFVPLEQGGVVVRDALDRDADQNWGFTVLDALPGCQVALCWERQSSCFAPALALRLLDTGELQTMARRCAPREAQQA